MVEGSRGLCLHFPALPAMSMDYIRKPNAGKVLNGPQCLSASVWDLYHTCPGHAPSFPQIRRACSPAVWAATDLCSFLQLGPHTRKIRKLISLHPNPSYLVLHTQCHTTEVSEVTEFSSRISHEHVGHNGLQNYYSSRGPALSICLKLSVISIFLCDKFFGLFCFVIGSQTRSKLTLKSQSSLLDLLSAGIIMGTYHHTWLLLINFQI